MIGQSGSLSSHEPIDDNIFFFNLILKLPDLYPESVNFSQKLRIFLILLQNLYFLLFLVSLVICHGLF